MESQRIKILLDRYWEGISSVEEEAQLRAVFGTEVPKDEAQYSVLFSYRELAGSQKEEDFDLSFLPAEEFVAEKKREIRLPGFVRWSMGIAATVLIAVLSVVYQMPETQTLQAQNQEIAKAYTETLAALQMVSDKLNKGNASIMEIGVFDRTKNRILDENN